MGNAMTDTLPDGFSVDPVDTTQPPDGFKVDALPAGFTADSKPEEPPGFLSRVGTDWSQRAQNIGQITNPIHGVGQVAGGINDVAKEAISSGINAIPDKYKKNLSAWGEEVAQSPIIQKFAPYAKQGMENIQSWEKEYPETTKYAEDIGNIAGAAPVVKGLSGGLGILGDSMVGSGTKTATMAAKDAVNSAKNPSFVKRAVSDPEKQMQDFWQHRVTPDQANHIAALKYGEAEKAGASLISELNDKFIDNAKKAVGAETAHGSAVPPSDLAQKILNNLDENARGQPLTLRGAQELEEKINKQITYQPNGLLTPESADLLKIKKTLRDTINSAQPQNMIGGPQGWQAWNEAKRAYSARGILTDLHNIMEKSSIADQPGSALKRNLARWSIKPSSTAGLDLNEMDLVKDSIKNDFAHEILRSGSSRLVPIGAAALGVGTGNGFLGATAGTLGAMGGRNLGFARQLGKMGDLADAIGERLPNITSEAPVPTPLALPNYRVQNAAEKLANAAKGQVVGGVQIGAAPLASEAENFAAQSPNWSTPYPSEQKMLPSPSSANPSEYQVSPWGTVKGGVPYDNTMRQRAAEIGLTPDVARAQNTMQETNFMQKFAEQKANEKAAQEAAAWANKPPEIKTMIDRGLANQQDLSEAVGDGVTRNDITEALLRARQGKAKGGRIAFKMKLPKK